MSGVDLAKKAGLTAVTVSRLERTHSDPAEDTVAALASALDYPRQFFFGPDVDEVGTDAASFRSLKSMTARERDAALGAASIAYILSDFVEAEYQLPRVDLLDLSSEGDPFVAARRLRSAWGIGEQPISNMIDLLEAKGVRVFSLCENSVAVDAFSCWRNNVPYVFLNTLKSAEHSRFDAAHELGHLCLHRHGGREPAFEAQANSFASSFLMPDADLRARVRHVSALSELRTAKKRWGVSIGALTYRLSKLGILSEWQSRRFFIEINRLGFRTSEPDPIAQETSAVWRMVLQDLWARKISRESLARSLHIPTDELNSLVFGLTAPTIEQQRKPFKLKLAT